jgi:hypothetical protein
MLRDIIILMIMIIINKVVECIQTHICTIFLIALLHEKKIRKSGKLDKIKIWTTTTFIFKNHYFFVIKFTKISTRVVIISMKKFSWELQDQIFECFFL